MVLTTLNNKNMQKCIMHLFIIIGLVVGCCKDHTTSDKQNMFHGKLKTFDDFYFGQILTPTDTAKTYLFYYDSVSGLLNHVGLKIKFNTIDTIITFTKIYRNADGSLYVYHRNISSSDQPIKYRVYTNGKQITSIVSLDTISNTEVTVVKLFSSGNITDSIFNEGSNLNRKNITYSYLQYFNFNCTNYNTSWWETDLTTPPFYFNKSSEFNVRYTDMKNTYNLIAQNCLDMRALSDYISLLLYFLSIDGYYIIPTNQHLINNYTEYRSGDTILARYQYDYNGNQITHMKLYYYNLQDTSNFDTRNIYMTYY